MERDERWAILVALLEALKNRGSWCGETHIQKSVFLLQEVAGVDMGYDFVLYKHGPFSFDLRNEIGQMRARNALGRKVQPRPYGPSLFATDSGKERAERLQERIDEMRDQIDFVGNLVNDRGVSDLERLSTAFFLSEEPEMEGLSVRERAERLVEHKPHVALESAMEAVQRADAAREELQM